MWMWMDVNEKCVINREVGINLRYGGNLSDFGKCAL